jgi:hypothetical protein
MFILLTSVPYMNRELRKAIYKKQMLRSKFEKYKTTKTWEAYRKQRNIVIKLKRKSINTYFQERCTGGQKSKHFYTTVKPFLSKKSPGSQRMMINDLRDFSFKIIIHSVYIIYTLTRIM